MRKLLALTTIVGALVTAHVAPAQAHSTVVFVVPGVEAVQYYEPERRGREDGRAREEWRRREEWHRREEWREAHRYPPPGYYPQQPPVYYRQVPQSYYGPRY